MAVQEDPGGLCYPHAPAGGSCSEASAPRPEMPVSLAPQGSLSSLCSTCALQARPLGLCPNCLLGVHLNQTKPPTRPFPPSRGAAGTEDGEVQRGWGVGNRPGQEGLGLRLAQCWRASVAGCADPTSSLMSKQGS